ncbi:reverse transcriptase domain-containing protein [Tanacetum coccineum]
MSAATEALIAAVAAALPSSPPPSPLTSLSSPLPQIPSPPLPLPSPPTHTSPTYDEALLDYRATGIWLRAASPSTHHPSEIPSPPLLLLSTSYKDDLPKANMPLWKRARFTTPTYRFEVGESSAAAAARQPGLEVAIIDDTVGCPMSRETLEAREPELARDPEPHDRLADASSSSNRSRNGDDNHDSGTCVRRQVPVARECTYTDFLKCKPLNFKGNALMWWNSHVKTVGHDVAYAMTWKTLKKMMTDKYCPRGEIKKLEIELWNLKVKGTDVESYNQRFQELALMCGRMFPKDSNEVEKYVGGIPDMIQGSVMASKTNKI